MIKANTEEVVPGWQLQKPMAGNVFASRHFKLFLLVCIGLVVVTNLRHYDLSFTIPAGHGSSDSKTAVSTGPELHPIQHLHNKWSQHFDEKIANQSQTLENAVHAYQNRYGRQPPHGFDMWYNYARDNAYTLIDEFDTIYDSIEPLWQVEPRKLRERVAGVEEQLEPLELERYVIHHGAEAELANPNDWFGQQIDVFSREGYLPDMTILMNQLDEPRVQITKVSSLQSSPEADEDEGPIEFTMNGHRHFWAEALATCHLKDRLGLTEEPVNPTASVLPFLDRAASAQDVCQNPSILHEHSFYISPGHLTVTNEAVPLFTSCRPASFHDILYPSSWYGGDHAMEKLFLDPSPDWNTMTPMLYWAGSSTGGFNTGENWRDMHRARIALMVASDSSLPVTLLAESADGRWTPIERPWASVSNKFNVSVTEIIQCDADWTCEEMERELSPGRHPQNKNWEFKYVMDIDGNSYSGRYHRLLRSPSAVIKSTIFREWHDDLLIPWVHYIPLSVGAEELGEMMRFLIDDPRGDAIGRAIAEEGQEWANRVLTEDHMNVYLLRLFLEYARVMRDDRDTYDFHLAYS